MPTWHSLKVLGYTAQAFVLQGNIYQDCKTSKAPIIGWVLFHFDILYIINNSVSYRNHSIG